VVTGPFVCPLNFCNILVLSIFSEFFITFSVIINGNILEFEILVRLFMGGITLAADKNKNVQMDFRGRTALRKCV
jgi:hypothetical protein